MAAHAVGHEKEMCALLANLHLRFRQARLPDTHRFREFGDQELILIGRAHFPVSVIPKAFTASVGSLGVTDLSVVGFSACSCATVPSL